MIDQRLDDPSHQPMAALGPLVGIEHRGVTDPAIVRALLTVVERETYWAVTCGTCQHVWQVAFYTAESLGD